jgi:cell shape-determining protein MreD
LRAAWAAGALLLAVAWQTAVTLLAPGYAWLLDPFLLVVLYYGLTGGELQGMLAGAAAGWVQDVQFGGTVMGLGGLSKLLVGFGVGLASERFMLVGSAPRLIAVFVATLLDALLLERLALMFEVPIAELSFAGLVGRANANAIAGVALLELLERRNRPVLKR